MLKGFFGTYTPRMDDKGRVTLPARYRDDFAAGAMLVRGQDHCLYVFTPEGFEEFADVGDQRPDHRRTGPRLPALHARQHRRAASRRAGPDLDHRPDAGVRGSVQGPGHHRHRSPDGDLGRRRMGRPTKPARKRPTPHRNGGCSRADAPALQCRPECRTAGSCRPAHTRTGPDTTSPVPGPIGPDTTSPVPGPKRVGTRNQDPPETPASPPPTSTATQHTRQPVEHRTEQKEAPMGGSPVDGEADRPRTAPRPDRRRHRAGGTGRHRTATSRSWSAGSTNCWRRPSRPQPVPAQGCRAGRCHPRHGRPHPGAAVRAPGTAGDRHRPRPAGTADRRAHGSPTPVCPTGSNWCTPSTTGSAR